MEKIRTSDPLSVPSDGAVALDTTAEEAHESGQPRWLQGGILGCDVLNVKPPCHSSVLRSGDNTCDRFFFLLLFATEGHCCSAVLQPLRFPFGCTEVERHKLRERERERGSCWADYRAVSCCSCFPPPPPSPPPLIFSLLPPPAPETR